MMIRVLEILFLYLIGLGAGLTVIAIYGPSHLGILFGEIAWTTVWIGYILFRYKGRGDSVWCWREPADYKWPFFALLLLLVVLMRYTMWSEVFPTLKKMLSPSTSEAFGVVLLAPIREELFFRGFVMRHLSPEIGLWGALIVSSILFSFGHPKPLSATIQGLLLGWLYSPKGSGRLSTSIIFHSVQNLLSRIT